MSVQVDHDLERAFGQLYEIQKRLLSGGLSSLAVRQPLQDIIEGRIESEASVAGADKFASCLLSVEDQQSRLLDYSLEFWGGQFSDVIASLDARSDHAQRVDDLEILYVDFGSPERNVEMWWKVLVGTQPNAWRWDDLKTDGKHLRLHPQARQYEPGVHRVRINLFANWEPQNGRSVDQVRERTAHLDNQFLAHAEVLAAYGLHDELLRQQDRQNLPYADMAGFEATLPGRRPWTGVPYLYWYRYGRGVRLSASWSDYVNYRWAAPVVWES